MNQFIKNFPHQQVTTFNDEIQIQKGQIVSKTLSQNSAISITLFAFDKGEEIGTHESIGDALVNVIEGTGKFIVDGQEYILNSGNCLVMPANKPHSVYAQEAFKMMLTVVFPLNK